MTATPTAAQLTAADVDYRAASPADHAAFRLWCLEQSKAMPINDYAWLAWRKATDALTGVGSRHAHQTRAVDNWQSYIIVDVNNFKQINDTHGHPVGDAILAAIGKLIRDESDHVFRTGGDEFAVVLNASFEAANVIADRIKNAIASRPILGIACSVSVGVGATATAADAAMYHQKITGPSTEPTHVHQ